MPALLLALLGSPALAAPRTVLAEGVTDPLCEPCTYAGQALNSLVDVYPDSFAFVQYHINEAETEWSNARAAFYGLVYTPLVVFNGVDRTVGADSNIARQYNVYRVNHFLPEREVPTDVTLSLSAVHQGGQTYRARVEVAVEAGGAAKTLRIYVVQVLDHWPTTHWYYRNGFKQAAPETDVALVPGQPQVIEADFTLDADSWAQQQNVKLIAWAQAPLPAFPAQVYQAVVRPWPIDAPAGDWDGDGVGDQADNCPRRANADQADGDADGAGDACDNCLGQENPSQADTDEDTFGDECDSCPVLHSSEQTDNDGDGVGNPCDACPDVPAAGGVDALGKSRGCVDLDCDVDENDILLFAGCLAGPNGANPLLCDPQHFGGADADEDGDVDLADAAVMQLNFSGPLVGPATYVGVANCIECHLEQHSLWLGTPHQTAIDTLIASGDENNVLCLPCHTVGYAEPSGFVDLATTPQLANVQCESCHGPGSVHAAEPEVYSLPRRFEASFCGSCHQSCHGLCGPDHHPQYEQWQTTKHATALGTLLAAWDAEDYCLQCHSTDYRLAPWEEKPTLATALWSVECVACHSPHGSAEIAQLRLPPHLLCADCHTAATFPPDTPDQPQSEMLHSTGCFDLNGEPILAPFTEHWWGIPNECVGCHMYKQDYGGPSEPVDSGHSFVANMRACLPCHTEAEAMLLVAGIHYEFTVRLAAIRPYFDPFDPLYIDPNYLPPELYTQYLFAKFDYEFVEADRSFGTHNPGYARTLLNQTESFLGLPPWPLRPLEPQQEVLP